MLGTKWGVYSCPSFGKIAYIDECQKTEETFQFVYPRSKNPNTHATGKEMHAMGLSTQPWGPLPKNDGGPCRGTTYVPFAEGLGPNVI